MALKEKLEEMRERAAMALDLSFANSLLSAGDFDDSVAQFDPGFEGCMSNNFN